MASFRKRLVDQPGFVVEVHPSLDDVDARQILRRVAKEFKGVTPWVGSSTTTYESDSGLEVLVTVLMRGDQTVLVTMGKPRQRPPAPPPRTGPFKVPQGLVLLGHLGDLKRSAKLLPPPNKAPKKAPKKKGKRS